MGEGVGLFCAFIDYKKVFDSVNRSYLWRKLLNHTMFKITHNLYANAKSCVRVGHFKSELFCSNIGVRQSENLLNLLHSLPITAWKMYLTCQNIARKWCFKPYILLQL